MVAVNGPEATTIDVPLTFLGSGMYRLVSAADDEADPAVVVLGDEGVNRGATIRMRLRAGGGYLGRLSRSDP